MSTSSLSRAPVAGRILGGLAILALAADAAGKLFVPAATIAHSPLATHTLVGVYLGLVVWAGLALHEPRVRALFAGARA